MRLLVASRSDTASLNIRDRLLESSDWDQLDAEFRGAPVHRRKDAILVEIEGPAIQDEQLSSSIDATGWGVQIVWFLSRHRAASGKPSLTVHPIGNHGEADFGGQPETLSPAAARDMGALLRRLKVYRDEHDLPHDVTYEATHHGPLMDLPTLFVEIGSDEQWYEDRPSGEALAAAVHDVLDGKGFLKPDTDVLVGVGGGHYMPRITDKALAGEADFGHMVPGYALDGEDLDGGLVVLERARAATPGCTGHYMHKKGLKGPQRDIVRAWVGEETVA